MTPPGHDPTPRSWAPRGGPGCSPQVGVSAVWKEGLKEGGRGGSRRASGELPTKHLRSRSVPTCPRPQVWACTRNGSRETQVSASKVSRAIVRLPHRLPAQVEVELPPPAGGVGEDAPTGLSVAGVGRAWRTAWPRAEGTTGPRRGTSLAFVTASPTPDTACPREQATHRDRSSFRALRTWTVHGTGDTSEDTEGPRSGARWAAVG